MLKPSAWKPPQFPQFHRLSSTGSSTPRGLQLLGCGSARVLGIQFDGTVVGVHRQGELLPLEVLVPSAAGAGSHRLALRTRCVLR